jgi:hypothetical protein
MSGFTTEPTFGCLGPTYHTWLKWLMDAVFLMQVGALVRAFWD